MSPVDETVRRRCPECDQVRDFEQPPCIDGHDIDCPELACVSCGLAVFSGDAWAAVIYPTAEIRRSA